MLRNIKLDYENLRKSINVMTVNQRTKDILTEKATATTHTYIYWLADVHSAGFAPSFTLSFHDSECSRKPPNAHSLGRCAQV
ncbi:MAG TPA: hypothetical protein VIK55_17470 [Paludibacter sp.]